MWGGYFIANIKGVIDESVEKHQQIAFILLADSPSVKGGVSQAR
jgi:hypothetical protein